MKNLHDLNMKPNHQLAENAVMAGPSETPEEGEDADASAFLSDARVGHWDWDRKREAPTWSRQVYRMLGISAEPLTVERYCASVHQRNLEKVKSAFHSMKEGKADFPISIVHTLITACGTQRLVVLRADAVETTDGTPSRYAGSLEELGERKQAVSPFSSVRLLDAQRRFEQAFQHSLTPRLIVTPADGRIVRANGACLRLLDMSAAEARTRSSFALGYSKDGLQWRDFVARVEQEGQASGIETRIPTRQGVLDVLLSGYAIEWVGQPHILLELQDITARRRFEASFYMGAIPTGISDLDSCIFIDVNDAYLDLLGYTREQLIGNSCVDLNIWQDAREWDKVISLLQLEGSVHNFEAKLVRRDGEVREVLFFAQAVELQDRSCFLSQVRDITERKRAERKLKLAAATLEHLGEALVIADARHRVVSINPAFSKMTGYPPEEVLGRTLKDLIAQPSQHQHTFQFQDMLAIAERDGIWEGEIWTRRKSGEIFPQRLILSTVHDGGERILNYVGVLSDITQHKEYEAQLKHIAYHDALTSLPNRKLFAERCQQAILRAQRTGGECAVLYLDLDRFKPINDTHGHEVGDKLLQEVACRMQGCVRATDTVARLGGDEFVVLLDGLGSRQNAERVAGKMVAELAQAFRSDDLTLFVSASVGIAVWPEHGQDVESLLRQADRALYQAKESGRNTYRVADGED